MAKQNNTIFWIIGIVVLVLVLTQPNIFKKQEMIKLTPHYYKDGVEVFPQKGFPGFVITPNGAPPNGNGECISGETKCEGTYYYECIDGTWVSQGQIEGKCGYTTCISHSTYQCYDNDVYWYDSCGVREEKKEECGINGCLSGVCVVFNGGECISGKTKCEGTYYYECIDGTWVSQGQIEGKCGYTIYDQISFDISGIAIGVSFSNIKIVDASPTAFKDALPTTTKSLTIGESKTLWTSAKMDVAQFECQTINFWVKVSAVNDYTGDIVHVEGDSGDIIFGGDCYIFHDYYSCYNADVYWYDSDGIRNDKKEECGISAFTGSDYCYDNDVYRDWITRGCSGSSCFSSTSKVLQEDCGINGCSEGVCKAEPEGTYTGVVWDTYGSGAHYPFGITTYGNYIWVVSHWTDEVYKFTMDGTYTGVHWDTEGSGCGHPLGITTDGTYFWITDDTNDEVYKFTMAGVYTGTHWDTAGSGNTAPYSIVTNGNYFWVIDYFGAEVYKHTINGAYTGIHWDTEGSGNGAPTGIITYGNYFWITDYNDAEVYKYNLDGTYTGVHWDTEGSRNRYPAGITTDGTSFWIVDEYDDMVYKYKF